jgi:hypothetical protein
MGDISCGVIAKSLAMGDLVLRALRGRSWRAFLVSLLGSGALVAGKCLVDTSPLVYPGLGLLMGASNWSTRLVFASKKTV